MTRHSWHVSQCTSTKMRLATSVLSVLVLVAALLWLPVAAETTPEGTGAPKLEAIPGLTIQPTQAYVPLDGVVRINVWYTADAAWGLYGLDVIMTFDASHLQIIDACNEAINEDCPPGVQIRAGPLLTSAGSRNVVYNIADNVAGTIHYAATLLNPALPIYSDGVVLYFDATATAIGETCFAFSYSKLSTINGQPIPHTLATACVTVADPTAVTISSFTATGGNNAVTLSWATASEVDNLGFNLYRAAASDGPRTKINQEMIPSQVNPGNPAGARYSYIDSKLDKTKLTYYYWLEDVDLSGRAELHGPVEAGLLAPWLKDPPPSEPPSVR